MRSARTHTHTNTQTHLTDPTRDAGYVFVLFSLSLATPDVDVALQDAHGEVGRDATTVSASTGSLAGCRRCLLLRFICTRLGAMRVARSSRLRCAGTIRTRCIVRTVALPPWFCRRPDLSVSSSPSKVARLTITHTPFDFSKCGATITRTAKNGQHRVAARDQNLVHVHLDLGL